MGVIQREYSEDLLRFVRDHPIFKCMHDGIAEGEILPCLRKNEFHFYEGGARLFRFSRQTVYTHRRYVDGSGDRERALEEGERCRTTFNRIRTHATEHRKPNASNELAAVHKLFRAFAITRREHKPGQLALIDVEARFAKDKDACGSDGEKPLRERMIDLVFLMPDRRVLFMEAKCIGNPDIASTGPASVEKQVGDYEKHIRHDCVRDAINQTMKAQGRLRGQCPESAVGIFCRVPVLLLQPDGQEAKISEGNTWLKGRLAEAKSWTPHSEKPCVIDGRTDPAQVIRAFVEKHSG